MKELFTLLLLLAILLPLGLVPVANAEGEVTAQPFYVLSWSDMDNQQYPYLEGLATSQFSNIGDKARLSFGGASLLYGSYTDADVEKFAQAMKKEMDSRPEGLRYWHVFGPTKILKLSPKNVLFLDHGVVQLKDLMTAVLKKYKEIGGVLDGLVVDTEYIGMSSYYIYTKNDKNTNNAVNNPLVYKQIVDDPRYLTEVRPLLVERGFQFWQDITDLTPEIYSISNKAGSEYSLSKSIWNTMVRIRLNQYVNDWCYTPLKEYFPEATLSDYQSHNSSSWLKLNAVTDDGVALTGGNSIRVGTASSFSYYYARPGSSFFDAMDQYASFNDAVYESSPFNSLLYDVNFTRHMYSSTDTKQIAPWITSYVYGKEKTCSMARTPYYTELLYHLGLFDPEPFLSYTYRNEYDDVEWPLTCQIMNEIMAELTRVAGYSDRKPIELPQYWNTEFVLSGMYANGRNLWRVTPNTDEISLADFKVESSDPTFSVKGRTVTFPGGKIIADTPISTAGSCGYWVETAADVMPVITHDPARYANYPSLLEDFEQYAEGQFDTAAALPATAWDILVSGNSTSSIVATGDGKALALTGDVIVKNMKLPGKITAGDSYAEDQVWEITVTVPEGLSAEATITLLKYVGTEMRTNDGGIQLAGGKVYYAALSPADEKGNAEIEYKALTDISAGTYTFRRVMNFNDPEKFTSGYYVLDGNGKELAGVADVSVPVFTVINTISQMVKSADKTVLLDDYKLYPTGIAADFELYDARLGTNVVGADKDAPRAASTAYRLSWLNGTDQEEYLTVMAAIYQDGVLVEEKAVKEVKMLPGCDAVDTGIVDVAEGQSVLVYLKNGRPQQDSKGISPAALIPAAAAVVAGAAVTAALVATKAPKKAKEEE